MNRLPELTDDAIIDVAREGGIALIPRLAAPRRIVLAQLPADKRAAICQILQAVLPLGKPEADASQLGRGDQRYFRIEISWTSRPEGESRVVLIAEQDTPGALQTLWRDAAG